MELFCTKIKYTPEAMISIVRNKEDRSVAVESAIKSVGGNMLGLTECSVKNMTLWL